MNWRFRLYDLFVSTVCIYCSFGIVTLFCIHIIPTHESILHKESVNKIFSNGDTDVQQGFPCSYFPPVPLSLGQAVNSQGVTTKYNGERHLRSYDWICRRYGTEHLYKSPPPRREVSGER